jgi:glycosyltransferase involved in cell wall biosynthesis
LFEEAARRGHEQWAYSLDEEASHPALKGARAFRYDWPTSSWQRRRAFHGFHAPLAEDLGAWIAQIQPDLVHVQNCAVFRSTIFPALAASNLPILMTVHDFSLLSPESTGQQRGGVAGALKAWLNRRSLVRARTAVFNSVDLFLCPTEALRQGVGFPPQKARLLRLPIATAEIPPLPPLQPFRILFAGSLYRSKGIDVLLQAMARAGGTAAGCQLELAGEGDQQEPLQRLVTELGLTARVRFLGHCDAAQMESAYAACHTLVLPSRVPENSPLTVLEAGARGRPAIAPAAGGVPELLNEQRGWMFQPEDPADLARRLEEAAADPAATAERGRRMRDWVRQEFAPQRHWDAVESAWRQLCRPDAPA